MTILRTAEWIKANTESEVSFHEGIKFFSQMAVIFRY